MKSIVLVALLAAGCSEKPKEPEGPNCAGSITKGIDKMAQTIKARGAQLFMKHCATCHGETGKGDGKMAASIPEPKPSNLTDAAWKHGSTDGEIFTMIKDGSKGTGMRGYGARMKPDDMWNVVNYVRALAPPTAKK